MKNYISIAMFIAIVVLVNLLAQQFFFRFDLTENNQYTLSRATKNILTDLDDPVTVTAYFSKDLPPNIIKTKTDFQDMLVEYANLSKGMVDYEVISPETDEEKQQAVQEGIQPIMINVREKDQSKQQQAFMGAVLKMGDRQEVIPFIQPGTAMEYALSTNIKKMSVVDKPAVALVQGHGEPGLSDLSQVYQSLSILYQVENLDLSAEAGVPERYRALALVEPTDSIPPAELAKLDDYLSRGGKLFVAINTVNGDLQTAQGTALTTGLETWLRDKGVEVEASFLIDAQCGSVTVQQRQGFFTMNTPVQFPYLPLVTNFAEHPITEGLEQVLFPFASPVRYVGDSAQAFTPIAFSTEQAGIVPAPTYFDISKEWTTADFPLGQVPVAGVLEGVNGNPGARLVVVGDGDFPVTGQGRAQTPDNVNLMVNSLDWLSDDTGLIELRTKGVASRPIDQEYLGDDAEGRRAFLKYLNFGLPILLIIAIGIVRWQQQRNRRIRRMQERYQ